MNLEFVYFYTYIYIHIPYIQYTHILCISTKNIHKYFFLHQNYPKVSLKKMPWHFAKPAWHRSARSQGTWWDGPSCQASIETSQAWEVPMKPWSRGTPKGSVLEGKSLAISGLSRSVNYYNLAKYLRFVWGLKVWPVDFPTDMSWIFCGEFQINPPRRKHTEREVWKIIDLNVQGRDTLVLRRVLKVEEASWCKQCKRASGGNKFWWKSCFGGQTKRSWNQN